MKALDLRDTILATCKHEFEVPMYSLTYNRFDLYHENNTHWIAPSSDVPCYGSNKLFFRDDGNKIQYGIQIEKGFHDIFDDKDKRFKMVPTWDWYESIALINKGELDRFANELFVKSGKSVKVEITIMNYAWNVLPSSLTLTLNSKGLSGDKNLDNFHKLVDYFDRVRQFENSWCNIFIYQVLGPEANQDLEDNNTFQQFFEDYLAPFTYWLR